MVTNERARIAALLIHPFGMKAAELTRASLDGILPQEKDHPMPETGSIEELRRSLLARRHALLVEYREVETALRDFNRIIETARKAAAGANAQQPAAKQERRSRKQRTVPRRKTAPDITPAILPLVLAKGDQATFDAVGITREANERGLGVDQKQVSTVLRRALKAEKIRQLKPGGPRKPAIYANLAYQAGKGGAT